MTDPQVFELGDLALQGGGTLANAQLVYKTYGKLDQDKSNAILYPTSYSAQHGDIEWLIGEDRSCHLLTRRTKLVRCLL